MGPSKVIETEADILTLVEAGLMLAGADPVIHLAQPGGLIAKIAKSAIAKTEALSAYLMPAGLDQALTKEELRDLMTYLLRDRK